MPESSDPGSGAPKRRPAASPRRRTAPRVKRLIETAGPEPTTPVSETFLTEGVLAGSHGVRGELKMRVLTDQPDHLATVKQVYIGEPPVPMRLLAVREHGDLLLIRLEGITTPEQAKELSGRAVKIAGSDARPLAEGEYFLFQLIGLKVEDEQGAEIGAVSDLIETGAHDVLVVTPSAGGPDILIPNHPEYVLKMAPEEGVLVARLPVYDS
ncbi:MAG: ribosome maturation factor RimM [Thermomicrobiales bacterium]